MPWNRFSLFMMVSAVGLLHAAQPATGQSVRYERLKIVADDGIRSDGFGWSVSISGLTAIVGAWGNDDNGVDSGSAYLFDVNTGTQIGKLLPSDGEEFDYFGFSVAISGLTAIVGAKLDGDNGTWSGSAYLFDVATGMQIAKLLPHDGRKYAEFGRSVAISGSTAVVGAYMDGDNGTWSGSAYLFDATTGVQLAKLLPSDGAEHDYFGFSVAISESIVNVGAYLNDDNGAGSGSAYLFDVNTGTQIVKLLPSDGAASDSFGYSVAISGSTTIVGAEGDADNGTRAGSAYLFDVNTGTQMAKLLPSDGAASDSFGYSVAISGSTAVVGAFANDVNGENSGTAYLFDVATGTQIAKLRPTDGRPSDHFGCSVANNGGTAIVGARWDNDNGRNSGSAYFFDADGGASKPLLEFPGDCPGRGNVRVSNATPGGGVAIVYGFGDGPSTIQDLLPCAGTVLDVGNPQLNLLTHQVNSRGLAVLTADFPAAACGRLRVQALDLTTCETSEVVRP